MRTIGLAIALCLLETAAWAGGGTPSPPVPAPPRPSPPPRHGSACFYTMEEPPPRCSGVPPRPEELAARGKVRVCNACLRDADCRARARGRCVVTARVMCAGDGSRACAYPGDSCYASDATRSGGCALCLNVKGRATCAPLPHMPPAAPPRGPQPGPAPAPGE